MSPWIYWSGIIFVLILGVLVGWLSGLFKSLWKYVNSYRTSTKPAITHNAPSKPVEVARISYKLDDPEDQEQFDAFLDKDACTFSDNPTARLSASQIIEDQVLDQIEGFEKYFHGYVMIEADIQRGSLAVTLVFLATTVYPFIAQYNDFFESVSRIRSQLRGTFSRIDNTYRDLTGRNIRVNGNLSVKSRARVINNNNSTADKINDSNSISPVTVTNSISPPANNSDFNITINIPDKKQTGCGLPFTVLLILLASITIYVIFLNEAEQSLMLIRVIEIIQYILESAGKFLINLSQQLENFLSLWLILPFFSGSIGLL